MARFSWPLDRFAIDSLSHPAYDNRAEPKFLDGGISALLILTMIMILISVFAFVIALLLIALVAFFVAVYRHVDVDLSLPDGTRLKLSGEK